MSRVGKLAALVSLAALATWLSAGVAFAQSPGEGRVVEGLVVNGTEGGGGVAGLTVLLHRVTSDSRQSWETVADTEGRFRFEGVEYEEGGLYAVAVDYQGALYVAGLDLSEGSPPPVSLKIYEAVDDDTSITVASSELMFSSAEAAGETVWAWEIVSLRNSTDTTYVPGPEPMSLLRFSLPDGAQGLYVDTDLMGADVIQVDVGFALTASVPPGEHQVMYAYQFPYSGGEALVTKSLPYGAETIRVLAPPEVATLSSESIEGTEVVEIGDNRYQLLMASDLPRGSRVLLQLSGLPQPSFGERFSRLVRQVRLEYAAVTGLGTLMLSLIAYALWRRSAARPLPALGHPPVDPVDAEQGRLVREIAELDEGFESGTVAEVPYRRRREALTARLAAISKRRLAHSD